jgi:tRNA pseudouridine38-40 synthase
VPTRRLYAHFCHYPLDVEKMRQAAAYLIGEHDFASFCASNHQAEETVRNLYEITVDKGSDDIVTIRLRGNGFLYNMVRIIAGTLIRIGSGMYPPERMKEILEARNRSAAGDTAPAKGLTLVGIEYEKEPEKEIVGENEYYRYVLDQSEMVKNGTSVLKIGFCVEEELERLVRRMVHQAYRNGAETVFVEAPESVKIVDGAQYGLYRLWKTEDYRWKTEYVGK